MIKARMWMDLKNGWTDGWMDAQIPRANIPLVEVSWISLTAIKLLKEKDKVKI